VLKVNKFFGGTFVPLLQGRRIREETGMKQVAGLLFDSEDGGDMFL
jgi:hypothetical protein